MITNERQYRISKRRLAELRKAIERYDAPIVADRVGSGILAAAELEALRSEVEALSDQVRDYDELKSGGVSKFEAASLDQLPRMLISARIARGLSQRQLAEQVGLKEQQIQRYEADEYSTASLGRLKEFAEALRLRITETAQILDEFSSRRATKPEGLDWSKFPVKEMYMRGWFEGYSGSLDAAIRDVDSLARDYVTSILLKPAVAMHRRRVRSGSPVDDLSLLAWECRVISLAKRAQLKGKYSPEALTSEWMVALTRISNQTNGPARARATLQEAGIALVVEPHLANTHLDGAAILYGDLPVIGLTLRYDRLDNFWFVLFHEVFHILKHLQKGKTEGVFDDLDFSGTDQCEAEADALAGEVLIPTAAWNNSLARYMRSTESVKALATQLRISPAIVAGRVRHEARNYIILSDLVGQGEVRKFFPEASFGV